MENRKIYKSDLDDTMKLMNSNNIENAVKESIELIKGKIDFDVSKRLVSDYGFESIDVIDLFFEIQTRTQIEIDINEMSVIIGGSEGRRFNDITISDVINYLKLKST